MAMAVVASADAGLRVAPRATILQLRAPELGAGAFEIQARALVRSSTLPVLISSRCDVALAVSASGVNLPERDVAVRDARMILGDLIIGRSVHTLRAGLEAERDGADFVIFGPVWPSPTHPAGQAAGLTALAEISRELNIPVVAIGGVTALRIAECNAAGAAGYAAIGLYR